MSKTAKKAKITSQDYTVIGRYGLYCGNIKIFPPDGYGYKSNSDCLPLSAETMRIIADKIDQLNEKAKK